MPSTIEFNGLTKTGVAQTLTVKRAQQLQNYTIDASTSFDIEDTDYAALVEAGLKDRVGEVRIDGGEPLVVLTKDTHPNSAVVHLFLGPVQ